MMIDRITSVQSTSSLGVTPKSNCEIIEDSLQKAARLFVDEISKKEFNKVSLNEPQLCQLYVIHLSRVLLADSSPIMAQREINDIWTDGADTKRAVDIAFFTNEIFSDTKPVYSIEAKRLAGFKDDREKEYVVGSKKNGGIERFKIGAHGNKLPECGILGFIEIKSPSHWLGVINNWISDLVDGENWYESELLSTMTANSTWAKSYSIVVRKDTNLKLLHFWIVLFDKECI